MSSGASARDIKRLAHHLEEHGCRVREQKKKGWFVQFPNGGSTLLHGSVSDHRGWKNTRAAVLRAGVPWPDWFKF